MALCEQLEPADFVITVDGDPEIYFIGDQPRMRIRSGKDVYDIVARPEQLFSAIGSAKRAIKAWLGGKACRVVGIQR